MPSTPSCCSRCACATRPPSREDGSMGVTLRDFMTSDGVQPDEGRVQTYMTPDPMTLPSDHAPSEAAQIMSERRFRHIPVVDDGRLVGIVSIRDLVGAGLQLLPADAHVGSDFP